jgi:polar amino acid transport system substrate-binding protein
MPASHTARAALLACALAAAPAHALTFLTEENPPLNYTEGGKITGYATEVVAELGRRAKLPVKFEVMPWSKAFVAAQGGRDTCIYATARLENRENQFQWVGPIAFNRWGVYARRDFAAEIKSLNDLKPHRIGAVTFDAKGDYLKAQSVVNLLLVEDDRENPPRLQLPKTDPNYIDLWVTSLYGARKTAGAKAGDLKLVYIIRDIPSWLACGPLVPKDVVGKLSGALASMNKDGTTRKIADRYEGKFTAQ